MPDDQPQDDSGFSPYQYLVDKYDQAKDYISKDPELSTYQDLASTGWQGLKDATNAGIKAFQYSSPAAMAFNQAGNPKPQGDLLSQVGHVPGVGLAQSPFTVIQGGGEAVERAAPELSSMEGGIATKEPEFTVVHTDPDGRYEIRKSTIGFDNGRPFDTGELNHWIYDNQNKEYTVANKTLPAAKVDLREFKTADATPSLWDSAKYAATMREQASKASPLSIDGMEFMHWANQKHGDDWLTMSDDQINDLKEQWLKDRSPTKKSPFKLVPGQKKD